MIAPLVLAALAATTPTSLDLTADSLELSPNTREAVATGHVHAENPEIQLDCESARAFYGTVEGSGKREIVRLELSGSVHATRRLDGLVADAEKATWDRAEGRLVLTGDPLVKRGADELKGARINIQLATDAFDVEQPIVKLVRRPKEPARITAGHLTVTGGGAQAVFERNVQLKQGEYQGQADRLEATLDGSGTKARKIERLQLSGAVRMAKGEVRARAARADFDATSGDLVLEGEPRLDSGDNRLEGERIVYNGDTGKARVEKATARVKGTR